MKVIFFRSILLLLAQIVIVPPAYAANSSLQIVDASQVVFGIDGSKKVYFRNLDAFNSSWAGCCYNHWIDISTDYGRAQYALFLGAYYAHQRVTFFSDPTGGEIGLVGNF